MSYGYECQIKIKLIIIIIIIIIMANISGCNAESSAKYRSQMDTAERRLLLNHSSSNP